MARPCHRPAPFALACLGVFALAPSEAEASRIVYINTDPVTIQAGMGNDPALDAFNTAGFMTVDMDGWTNATPEQIEELLFHLKDTTVEYDVIFTLERPTEGPYDMIVFGSAEDNTAGFMDTCSPQRGLSDCGDGSGVSIGFLFWGCLPPEDQLDPHRVAFHTLGSLGYSWGLENVAGTGQIMSGYSASALKYGDACANLNSPPNACPHEGCQDGQQNSGADMLANLGARVDDGPPVLTVLEPEAGAEVFGTFDVVVDVDDGFGGVTAQLELVGADLPPVADEQYPYRWNGLELASGPVTLRITATDADGNEVSTDVPVCVGGGCPDTGDGDGDGDTGDGDTTESGGETGDPGADGAGGSDGGGCVIAPAPSHGTGKTALLVLAGLFAVGRSRRRSAKPS